MKFIQEKLFYELTNAQKSILMSEQFFGDPHMFVIPSYVCIKENLDFDLIKKTANLIIENNEALRTRFLNVEGNTYQYFANFIESDILKVTVNDLDELESFIKDITFNVYDAPLVKFIMFENLSGHGGLCCIIHHLIGDAWTLSLILDEVVKIYYQLSRNGKVSAARKSSYKDFILSENTYIDSERYINDKNFWEEKFSSPVDIMNFKNNTIFDTSSKRNSYHIPIHINMYCKENKISLFSFFFAAISIYFSRIFNSTNLTIGTPFLNRTSLTEKNCVGMFISTMPFVQNLDYNDTVSEYIKKITISQIGMLRHQKYPYYELQKYYTQKFGRINNLYDILFSYQNAKTTFSAPDFNFESKWLHTNHQAESLVISILDTDNTNNLLITYDFLTNVFSDEEIGEMNNRILFIAEQMVNMTDKQIKEIEIVTPDERKILLEDFNNTDVSYNKNDTIVNLFTAQAQRTPDNIALIFADKTMTYKELNEKSNYVANLLLKNGVKKDAFVGVLLNRSFEMIISILGVLKSGAAYMPINPAYPADRISYMIQDSNCKFVLTSNDVSCDIDNVQKLVIDNSTLKSLKTFDSHASGDCLAYVIYTSGSTGKPKGVMIKHSNIINTLLWRKEEYHFDSEVRVLQIPSFAFDSSVEDIFTPLISGASLVLLNTTSSSLDISLIRELIIKHHPNHMLVVPSFYTVMLSELSSIMQGFKHITVAGEGFSIELVRKHFDLLSDVELYNEYGPTENSVCTTFYKFNKNDDTVYIGKPLNNCKCYILNDNLKLQPYNVKGELCVSGPGLAKGYIGKKDLTDSRFIPNPFLDGSLMYKTGDIVSINSDGLMTFHERVDHQVKYNGFRIDLGEIENNISSYIKNPNVVVLLKKTDNRSSLNAYIESDVSVDVSDLKQNLKKFLPYYMIPKEFYTVPSFPLTPNGKIDRTALSNLTFEVKDVTIIAPRNETDAKILAAWKIVLKQKNISIDDNIFDIGGDSLSLLSIQSILFKDAINVNSQVLFENPTIRSLSDYITENNVISMTNLSNENDEKIYLPAKTSIKDIDSKGNMPKNVLLTGSTGFLGSHILAELITDFPDIKVYCLVRSKPNKSYTKRLSEILNYYFGEKYDLLINDRIIPLEGDLVRDKLGINITLYKELTEKIDCIINAASLVKHFGDYNLFYNSNVVSVKNIIKFAKEANAQINHVSTTSVSGNYLVKNDIEYNFTENDFYIGQNYKDNVYVRTKFEAENELFKAQTEEGIKVNIFRIGNLMQRTSDGVFQINKYDNAYFKRIYGFIKLGEVPSKLLHQELEFTPVDYCATAIVKLISYSNKIFHLLNPNVIDAYDLFSILQNYSIKMNFVSMEKFIANLRTDKYNKYLENFITDFNDSTKLDYNSKIIIKSDISNTYLHHNSFAWPVITNEYLNLFIKNLLEGENEQE